MSLPTSTDGGLSWSPLQQDVVFGAAEWKAIRDDSTCRCGLGGKVSIAFDGSGIAGFLQDIADVAKGISVRAFLSGLACYGLAGLAALTGVGLAAAPFLIAAGSTLMEVSALTFEASIGLDAAALLIQPGKRGSVILGPDLLTLGVAKVVGPLVNKAIKGVEGMMEEAVEAVEKAANSKVVPEEVAPPSKRARLSKNGKTAEELAYEEMQKYHKKNKDGEITNSQVPNTITVAVGEDGSIYIGKNGTLTRGAPHETIPDQRTVERFGEKDAEGRPGTQCAEADAVDQIYKDNQNPDDFDYHTVGGIRKTGEIYDKHTCDNCDVNMKNQIENGNVKSNTEGAKQRKIDSKINNKNSQK